MRTIKDDESDIPITPDLFEIRGFFLEVLNARIPVYTETTLMRPPTLTVYLAFSISPRLGRLHRSHSSAIFCMYAHVYAVYKCIRR